MRRTAIINGMLIAYRRNGGFILSHNSIKSHENMSVAKDYWDDMHESYTREEIQYDDWLRQFESTIQNCRTPIIDLGCGSGNDTKYLLSRGKAVIVCDFSLKAIENIRKNFPEVLGAECFDMTESFPFEDNFSELIIADLSIHYFSEEVTEAVLEEIKRVLKPNGILLLRVNSVKDFNHGAGQGTEIERNYFRTADGRFKRFFDREDICKFFGDWEMLYLNEGQMIRYPLPKMLWTAMCRVTK